MTVATLVCAWRRCGPTATAAAWRARSTWSASAGRSWSCASSCSGRSASATCAPGCRGVAPDVLSQRLRELEAAGVLRRRTLPPPAGARVYELTEWGQELEPLVIGLGRWGSRAPFPGGDAELGADAFVIALKTLFDPAAAAGSTRRRAPAGRRSLPRWRSRGGRFEAARGSAERPDAVDPGRPRPARGRALARRAARRRRCSGDVALEQRSRVGASRRPAPVRPRAPARARRRARARAPTGAGAAPRSLACGSRRALGLAVVEAPGHALELGVDGEARRRRDAGLERVDRAARSPRAPSSSACRSRGAGSSR